MMRTLLSISLVVTTLTTGACQTKTQEDIQMNVTKKEKVIALLKSIETGDAEPIAYVNPEKYIQHNLAAADGLAGFGELMAQLPPNSAKVKTVRVFEDGDFVITHTEYDFFGPKIGFDIFRFEDGLIVEHWDNLQEILPANPSGRTQTDGATKLRDHDKTEENKAFVKQLVQEVLIEGQFATLPNYFDGDDYLQHNAHIADGLSGLGAAIEEMNKQGLTMVYEKNHVVLGEGNFVLAVSEGYFGGRHVSYYDLFRIENGKIAEHWDVIEEIPVRTEWKNNNGKFGF